MSDDKLSWHLTTLRAIMASDLEPTARHVLHILAFHGDWITGERIHPSIAKIAAETGYTERCVFKMLASLEASGWVVREAVRGRPSNYRVTVPQPPLNVVHPCTTFTPERSSPLNVVHPTPERGSGAPERSSPNHTIIRPSNDPLPSQEFDPVNGSRAGERAGVGAQAGEGVADMIPDRSLDQSVMDLFHSHGRMLATKRYHDVAAAFQTRAEGGVAMRALARGLERLKGDISHDGAATIAIRCAARWIAEQKIHDELERDPTPPAPRMSREELSAELERRNAAFVREQDAIAEAARAARQPAPMRNATSTTTTTTTQGAA